MKKIIGSLALCFLSTSATIDTIKTMSLRQKIAQLCIVAAVSNEAANKDFMRTAPYRMDKQYVEELITVHEVGGIIFLGTGTVQEQATVTAHFQQKSRTPLLVALDAEWGLAMRLANGFRFPHNMTLGALTDNELVYQMAYEIGQQLREIGVHLNLAPVIDVNNNRYNPVINERSFGARPANVAEKGVAYMRGLEDAGIIACAKHFPGHGDTDVDSHLTLPTIAHSRIRLNSIELVPFKAAVEYGVRAIMSGHIQLPALEPDKSIPASLSKAITTDLLRNEFGYKGLIITDGLGMQGVLKHHQPGELEVKALEAGADILLCPVDPIKAIDAIEQAVLSGRISEQSIDEKVMRVLQSKAWAFSRPACSPTDKTKLMKLKKQIFAKAITMAKDTLNPLRDKSLDAVMNITQINAYSYQDYGISQAVIADIDKLKQTGKSVTVVLYGTPYAADRVRTADRIIVAYEDDGAAREAVQQILAGHACAEGKLPV